MSPGRDKVDHSDKPNDYRGKLGVVTEIGKDPSPQHVSQSNDALCGLLRAQTRTRQTVRHGTVIQDMAKTRANGNSPLYSHYSN